MQKNPGAQSPSPAFDWIEKEKKSVENQSTSVLINERVF